MANGMGYKVVFGFGTETTYGTGVASANFLEVNNGGDGLDVTENRLFANSILNVWSNVSNAVQGDITCTGALTFDMRFAGMEKFFMYGMGADTITQPEGTTIANYQHIYKLTDTLATSLSVSVSRDICAFRATGSMISSLNFKGSNSGFLTCTANIVAQDMGTMASETPSLPTAPFITWAMGVCTYGGGTYNLESWDCTINNNLDTSRRFIGSRTIKQPLRNGKVEVTGNLTFEFEDAGKYGDFRNMTTKALSITYTGATMSVGTSPYYLDFTFGNIKLTSGVPKATNEGRIKCSYAFKAFASDTNTREVVVTLRNITATD